MHYNFPPILTELGEHMPLLHKQQFEPQSVPDGVTRDTPVFYCKATKEVFLTHEEYFNRMILLNSTAWSCSLTRKSNLTYFEAIASEREAEQELCNFPTALEIPITLIVHKYTNRGRFEDLVNDIYHILKDRFFNNEEVAYAEKSRKFLAKIVESNQIEEQNPSFEGGSELKEPILPPPDTFRYTLQILDPAVSEEEMYREGIAFDRLFRSKNIGSRQKIRLFLKNCCQMSPDSERYTLKFQFLEKIDNLYWTDVMSGAEPICPQTPALQRGRAPNTLKAGDHERKEKKPKKEERDPAAPPRPRGRPPKTPEQKALDKKEKQMRKRAEAGREAPKPDDFDLTSSGAMTLSIPVSPAKKKIRRESGSSMSGKKKTKILEQQGELCFFFSEARRLGIDVGGLEQEEKLLSGKAVADFKQRVKEEKDAEKERAKEEKKRKMREKTAYNKKREDLICNDLKPLPRFPKLEIPEWISNAEFEDYLFIFQFFNSFKQLLPLKEIRGSDEVQFSDIIIAIKCNDPQNSSFADLLRVLLSIRTDIADEEDGDEADINNREEVYLINAQNCDPAHVTHGDSIRDLSDLHFKIRKIHGKSVRHLPVDWMTLTEVLRLIFETSGYYTGMATHRHRLYARGNFRGYEDPAYEFRTRHPGIMEKLRTLTVFDLEAPERLEIVKTLIYQLLTYSKFRGHLEQRQNELVELKREQKKLKAWDVGQEGEANAARLLLELAPAGASGAPDVKEQKEPPVVRRLKAHIKAINEGRRYDKEDLDAIVLESVPYASLSLDEIVTARELQKSEFKILMDSLISKMFQIYSKISDIRLGSDRAYRRYIVMENLSAILVETATFQELGIYCDEPSIIDDPLNLLENEHQEVFICTGNMDTCRVHGDESNNWTRWSYIRDREQFEQLLKSLNPRGNREVELLEELNEYRPSLLEILEETERLHEEEEDEDEWKSQFMTNDPNPGDTYNIDWDAEMRDLLLDFEEKIDQGQMGSIEKIFECNRIEWRDNLKESGNVCMLLNEDISIFGEISVNLEESEHFSDSMKLAIAFYMIIKSIHLKFIKAPYISPNKDEHGNLKPSELFIRWQRALLECESHSALSLFISTFEGSIKWDKSRLQGKCRSCRRKAAAHDLVLCSECDNCYHLKCAKLDVNSDAPADWMCTSCRAQQRKVENEAKRMARDDDQLAESSSQEDVAIGNISISDNFSEIAPKTAEPAESCSTPTTSKEPPTIRTASGRAVKRVHYSDIHEGLSLKNRKSNGSMPVTPSERPVRNVSVRIFDVENENVLTDEDDSDGENTRKRKTPTSKKSVTSTPTTNDISRVIIPNIKEKMTLIETLLKEAMRQECSWPFLQPVDSKEVPDYYDVIKRPMNLRTMMNKIKQRIYNKPIEVRNDFQLILSNCETYNEPENEIYKLSRELHDFMADRLDEIIDQ